MITSGWILPDMYEVSCKSCLDSSGHKQIVKQYLEQLKVKNYKLYIDIMILLFNQRKINAYLSIDDFAVSYLGWIKINNFPINMIFYSKNNPLEFLVQKYIDFGYKEVVLEKHSSIFEVPISSNLLI